VKTGLIRILFPVLILLALLVLSGCNSAVSSSTSSQTSTTAASSTISSQTTSTATSSIVTSTASTTTTTNVTTTSPTPPNTFGALAASGQTIYNKFAASCHGESGGGRSGPALIGSNAGMAKYNTAQGLLDYISATMPLGAPGKLSHQEYLEVLCYLLVQNNYVSADKVFNEAQLSSIILK
jgi:cytochrome c